MARRKKKAGVSETLLYLQRMRELEYERKARDLKKVQEQKMGEADIVGGKEKEVG